jgi:DNA modification methylase
MEIASILDTVICGDALEVLRDFPDKSIDLILTDPPYGIKYAEWDATCPPWFADALRVGKRIAFTPGLLEIYNYPKPRWIFCWAKPGSVRRNISGGFNHWQPVLIYGDGLYPVDYKCLPDCVNHSDMAGHPCPKPKRLMGWLCAMLTDPGDLVLDCFVGSGTTLVAAKELGRHYIGIDISPEYCALARRRIAQVPPSLFEDSQSTEAHGTDAT